MEKVRMHRIFMSRVLTLSDIHCVKSNGASFHCKGFELGWNDNKKNSSCIPKGVYTCRWTKSPKFSKEKKQDVFTYEVLAVRERSGIRVHPVTYVKHLKGCIAFGEAFADIDKDGILDLTRSRVVTERFADFMNREDFILDISFDDWRMSDVCI